MSIITQPEIKRGLVAYLEPEILGQDTRTVNTSKITKYGDHSVDTGHFFVVIEDRGSSIWLCMPLFSSPGKDRQLLSPKLKSGFSPNWLDADTYAFRWQHWLIPESAIIDASINDNSPCTDRRYFDHMHKGRLDALVNLLAANSVSFHRPAFAT